MNSPLPDSRTAVLCCFLTKTGEESPLSDLGQKARLHTPLVCAWVPELRHRKGGRTEAGFVEQNIFTQRLFQNISSSNSEAHISNQRKDNFEEVKEIHTFFKTQK